MVANYYYYDNYRGESLNAQHAKENERYPMTLAKRRLSKLISVTQREAQFILETIGDNGEWHHSGKYATKVTFYNIMLTLYRLSEMSITSIGLFCKKPNKVKSEVGKLYNQMIIDFDDVNDDSLPTLYDISQSRDKILDNQMVAKIEFEYRQAKI